MFNKSTREKITENKTYDYFVDFFELKKSPIISLKTIIFKKTIWSYYEFEFLNSKRKQFFYLYKIILCFLALEAILAFSTFLTTSFDTFINAEFYYFIFGIIGFIIFILFDKKICKKDELVVFEKLFLLSKFVDKKNHPLLFKKAVEMQFLSKGDVDSFFGDKHLEYNKCFSKALTRICYKINAKADNEYMNEENLLKEKINILFEKN